MLWRITVALAVIHQFGERTVGDERAFKVSEQEQQLVEVLRQWTGDDDCSLEVSHSLGAWEIELFMPEKMKWVRGVGPTFDEAWDNMTTLPPNKP